jgi:hypothetical protein
VPFDHVAPVIVEDAMVEGVGVERVDFGVLEITAPQELDSVQGSDPTDRNPL